MSSSDRKYSETFKHIFYVRKIRKHYAILHYFYSEKFSKTFFFTFVQNEYILNFFLKSLKTKVYKTLFLSYINLNNFLRFLK